MAGPGFRGTSSVLLVVAVAATGGFLYWVYNQAQSLDRDVTPRMEDSASASPGSGSGTVTTSSLAANMSESVGRDADLDSVEVSGSLGRGVFTVTLDDTLRYPVLLGSQLIQQGTTVYEGDQVSVEGRVYTLNDSIATEWINRGAVDTASAEQIPSVPSFVLADVIDIQS